jgi:hypothetical protein
MRSLTFSILASVLMIAPAAQASTQLVPVGIYSTGFPEGAEVLDIRNPGLAVLANSVEGNASVDILDVRNPSWIGLIRRVILQDQSRPLNSVTIHPFQDYFLVAQGNASPAAVGERGTVSAYRLSNGEFLGSVEVGIQPDSVKISPNGRVAVVANEAEGADRGDNGGSGSVSVIPLSIFFPIFPIPLRAITLPLTSQAGVPGFSSDRTDDIARLPLDNTPATLEPENIAFSPNSRFAYITLQENSGVVRVRLSDLTLTYFGLGQTSHSADLTNDGTYTPSETLTAFREPDSIAVTPFGRFFVTADEGDTRDAAGASGVRGGRTVSVFDAITGKLVGDTGGQLDDFAAAAGLYPDSRSNRGGSEPEGLDLEFFQGRVLVAVGLERADAIALVDVTQPKTPTVVAIAPTAINGVGGDAPEGVKFLSTNGRLYVLSANEDSGTVSVFQVVP